MEPTLSPDAPAASDLQIAERLRSFVSAFGPATADVRLDYGAGVVTLTGAVPTATQRQAVEDLVRAHDGVVDVVLRTARRDAGRHRLRLLISPRPSTPSL